MIDKKEYDRLYYLKHKEEIKKQQLEYYFKNREAAIKRSKKWRLANHEKYRLVAAASSKKLRKKVRKSIFEKLGGKCIKCGFLDERALQIDHINGGGKKEFKSFANPNTYYRFILESVINNENKYQILCANCNWIKRYENNEQHLTT